MIHSSYYQPVVMPIFVDDTLAQIDRVQALTATTTLNRTKIEEVGRVGIVDWKNGYSIQKRSINNVLSKQGRVYKIS